MRRAHLLPCAHAQLHCWLLAAVPAAAYTLPLPTAEGMGLHCAANTGLNAR